MGAAIKIPMTKMYMRAMMYTDEESDIAMDARKLYGIISSRFYHL